MEAILTEGWFAMCEKAGRNWEDENDLWWFDVDGDIDDFIYFYEPVDPQSER